MSKRIDKKKKSKRWNASLLGQLTYQGDNHIPTSVELIQYNSSQVLIKEVEPQEKLKPKLASDKVNWYKITGISDAQRIGDICYEYGLHGFDVRDLLSDQQVVKVVVYDNIIFVLMSAFYLNGNLLEDMQIGFILGSNFVISIQESQFPVFEDVQKAIAENHAMLRQGSVDYLFYILMRAINMMNSDVVMKMEDQLDDIEDQLLQQKNSPDIMQLLRIRRIDYTHIKRFIVSLREEYNNILHNTNKLIKKENLVYFNDYDDKLRTTMSNLESFHETLLSLLDIYYNNNNLRMNSIMKQLTIVSTIFIPLTFIAGVWGMNFEFMPEIKWRYGYWFAWCIFVVIVIFVCILMKRKKWF